MITCDRLSAIVSLMTATTAALVVVAPPSYAASVFLVNSGVTSVTLDTELLASVGLSLTGADNTVPAADRFLVGFNITPETNFTFSNANGFTLLGGAIAHEGSVTFNDALTVGNFSIGFDQTRVTENASGLFVRDTLDTEAILFDVVTPSELAFEEAEEILFLEAELLISDEFAEFLGNTDLAGGVVGAARTEAMTSAIPEPSTILGTFLAGGLLSAVRRRTKLK
ncbi:PEP-CTERM sorting domain-containing protein [Candidatus Gracilibacteria bacterium]|nr:PEP-CTERM sorting domain-containing protein [Candidatus Gracilibacteria bacterium]